MHDPTSSPETIRIAGLLEYSIMPATPKRLVATVEKVFQFNIHALFVPHSRQNLRSEISSFQQMPGFPVLRVAGVFAVWGEPDVEGAMEGGEWEDVPGVGGDDVSGDEIDLVGGVRAAVAAD